MLIDYIILNINIFLKKNIDIKEKIKKMQSRYNEVIGEIDHSLRVVDKINENIGKKILKELNKKY